jgi:hypothetical protein
MKITKENFHLKTKATFSFIKYGDQATDLFNEMVKENGLFFKSNSGSKYVLYGETVYRISDHWGMVASCKWFLTGCPSMPKFKTNTILAKCDLSEFESMMKAVEYVVFEGVNKRRPNSVNKFWIKACDFVESKVMESFIRIDSEFNREIIFE